MQCGSLPDPQVMPNEKRAKQSAAHVFKTDPEVMEMPRNFPKGVMRLTNVAFCYSMKSKRKARGQHAHAR